MTFHFYSTNVTSGDTIAFELSSVDLSSNRPIHTVSRNFDPSDPNSFASGSKNGLICLGHSNVIEILDERTLEVVQEIRIPASSIPQLTNQVPVYRIIGAYATDSTVLLHKAHYFYRSEQSFELLSRDTGEVLESDIERYPISADMSVTSILYDAKSDTVLLPCQDNTLRMFDASDGKLLWEWSDGLLNESVVSSTSDGSRIVVQGQANRLYLLDAKTGEELDRTDEIQGVVRWTHFDRESGLVLIECVDTSTSPAIPTLYVTDLTDDTFEIQSIIPYGWFISGETGEVLIMSPNNLIGTVPHYSRDELLELADETLEGYELTEEERRRYGLG